MAFFEKGFSSSPDGWAFGMYFGVLFQNKFFKGQKFYVGPKNYKIFKSVMRVLVLFVIAYPISLLKDLHASEWWSKRVIDSILPNFLAYFYAFGICDSICLLLRLFDKRKGNFYDGNLDESITEDPYCETN